jgi:hypothetical protein
VPPPTYINQPSPPPPMPEPQYNGTAHSVEVIEADVNDSEGANPIR